MADAIGELVVRITGDASDLAATISDVQGQLVGLESMQNRANSASRNGAAAATSYAAKISTAGKTINEFGRGLDTVTKPLQVTSLALAASGVASAKFAIDFENNFAKVKKTVEGTPAELEEVRQGIIDLTTTGIDGRNAIPQTTAQLTELAAAGGQLGIKTPNIVEFTEVMAQMGTATNLYGAEGAATLARFMNVTNTSQGEVKNLGSAVVDLGNNFATTENEVVTLGLRMGATGNVVGVSAQDILGYSTALSSMGVEAEAGGSAVSRIWMDIQNAVSSGGKGLATFAKVSGKSSEEFANQWKTDASGAFQTFIKGLSKSEDQIQTLSELGFNNIRDIQALQRLASEKGINLMTEALERSNTAWSENIALQKEADNMAETTAGQIQITKNNLVEAARGIGETFLPTISKASGGIKDFAQDLANMSDEGKEKLVNIATDLVVLGAGAKGVVGLTKGIGGFVEALGKIGFAAPALAGAAPAALAVAGGVTAITAATVIGTKAYEAYHDAQLNVVKTTDEQVKSTKKSLDTYNKIKGWKAEAQKLETIIKTSADTAEVDAAKVKLDELKKQVEEEYKVTLTANDDDIDKAIEKLDDRAKSDLRGRRGDLQSQINDSDFGKAVSNMKDFDSQMQIAQKNVDKYSTAMAKANDIMSNYKSEQTAINNEFKSGTISRNEYISKQKQLANSYADELNAMYKSEGVYSDTIRAIAELSESGASSIEDNTGYLGSFLKSAQDDVKRLSSDFDKSSAEVEQYKEALRGVADVTSLLAPEQFASGDYEQTINGIKTALSNVKSYTKEMGFDDFASELTEQLTIAQQGFTNISQAAQSGSEGVNSFLTDFANNAKLAGASADDIAKSMANIGTSLVQNGADGNVVADILNSIADLPEGKTISINAEGNGIEIIDEVQDKADNLDGTEAHPKVVFDKDSSEPDNYQPDQKEGLVTFKKDSSAVDNYNPPNLRRTVTYSINTVEAAGLPSPHKLAKMAKENAKGTSDFSGGFAKINDQKGIPDPRELVEFGGKGYIFEGKDVVIPLPKHARVYTASQTKEILAARNIPHYAGGKNNEAWENAKSDRAHIRKTTYSIIPAWEELEWLDEMKKKFASDTEVIKEIEEESVTYTKKMWSENLSTMQYALDMGWMSQEEYYSKLAAYRDENFAPDTEEYRDATLKLHKYSQQLIDNANDVSKAWTDMRNTFNDWDEIGDSPLAAYQRINERNMQAVNDGLITYDEYRKLMNDTTKIISDRADYSFNWIDHAQKYEALDADGTIAGLGRIQTYVDEFFDGLGELTDEQRAIKLDLDTRLADEKMDTWADKVSKWEDDADWYQKQAEVYGWDAIGDSEADFYQRRIDKYTEFANNTNLSENERKYALRQADEMRLELYKATESQYDKQLDEYKSRMDEVEKLLNDKLSALDKKWEVEDRAEDKTKTLADIEKYKNAVTIEGRDKYQEALDKLKEIEREEQRYALEVENNAIMEQMQADYKALEAEKERILQQTKEANMKIASLVEPLKSNVSSLEISFNNKIGELINTLKSEIGNIKPSVEYTQNNYNYINDGTDGTVYVNRTYNQAVDIFGG